MKKPTFDKLLFVASLIIGTNLGLVGCGGGNGDNNNNSNSTEPTTQFQTFPDGYFTEGYTETYQLTGSDNAGGTYEGSLTIETQVEDVVDGVSTIPVLFSLEAKGTNAVFDNFSESAISYYTTDAADRTVIAVRDLYSDTLYSAISTDVLPETVTIDDFGTIGNYLSGFGYSRDASWRLDNANNGQAYLIIDWNKYSESGVIEGSVQETYLIDQNGTRQAVSVTDYQSPYGIDVTVTLSGDRK